MFADRLGDEALDANKVKTPLKLALGSMEIKDRNGFEER